MSHIDSVNHRRETYAGCDVPDLALPRERLPHQRHTVAADTRASTCETLLLVVQSERAYEQETYSVVT